MEVGVDPKTGKQAQYAFVKVLIMTPLHSQFNTAYMHGISVC